MEIIVKGTKEEIVSAIKNEAKRWADIERNKALSSRMAKERNQHLAQAKAHEAFAAWIGGIKIES